MKILFYSSRPYDKSLLIQLASKKHELHFTEKRLTIDTAELAAGCDAISLFTSDDASAEVLTRLKSFGIKYVALRSVGFDHIDLRRAAELGIPVANVPEYSPYAVAEHAVAMLMAVNRKIIESQKLMERQDFRIDTLKGFDLHGRTVGIIGTGKIGMAFASIMDGFGMKLLAYDPAPNSAAVSMGVEYVSLEELLGKSDVVSIHCPLTPQTRHLISDAQIGAMKKSAILINTSRGAVVDTRALIKALESQRLQAACLDVYEFEKGLFFEDHSADTIKDETFLKLRSLPNVLITAHQGFLTEDAITEIATVTIANIDCWQNNLVSPNQISLAAVHQIHA
jgi:D-lactate dehydrogenase